MYKRTFIFCIFIISIVFLINSTPDKFHIINSTYDVKILAHPCNGQDTINIVLSQPDSVKIISAKMFWSKGLNPYDSTNMVNTGGNSWRAIIYLTGEGTYKYYIKILDSLGRVGTFPAGAPANFYSFLVGPDTTKPVITHTPLGNIPKVVWPPTVNATVTDYCGIDSVWVRWRKNSGIEKHFKLLYYQGNIYSNVFNSVVADVNPGDTIRYRIIAQDKSQMHIKDSTVLYSFVIINLFYACIGSGTLQSDVPFNTYWWGSRTQMLWTASELIANSGYAGYINRIGFEVYYASSHVMNGFTIRMKHTNLTSLKSIENDDWQTVFYGIYTVPGTGWQYIDFQNSFIWNGTSNLMVEICFGNISYSTATLVLGSPATNMVFTEYHDLETACTTFNALISFNKRPNVCFRIVGPIGINNNTINKPSNYKLSQNYPNPFNPVTRIDFDIPKQGLVTLKVYDILGREVKELVNEMKSPGSYSVDFNAEDFSSGVYIYKLESNNFMEIKRMILIK